MLIFQQTHAQDYLVRPLSDERSALEKRGVRLALIYDAEGIGDFSGGARRGAVYVGNLNLELSLDLHALLRWPGATIYLDGLNLHGG